MHRMVMETMRTRRIILSKQAAHKAQIHDSNWFRVVQLSPLYY